MARKRSLASRYRRQVRAETGLRFDPEAQSIREAGRDARRQASGDIRAARQSARGIQRSSDRALPVARKRLGEALATVDTTPSPEVAASALGPAAGRDAAGAKRRLGEVLAGTEAELIMRKSDAAAGAASAVRQARSVLADSRGKLSSRSAALARQRGQFAQSRSGELVEGARDRGVKKRGQDKTAASSERGSKRSSGIDPDTGKPIPGGKLDPDANGKPGDQSKPKNGVKPATSERVEGATSAIALARQQVQRLKSKEGLGRAAIGPLLVEGRPGQSLKDPKTQQTIKVPGVKSVKQLWASIALDLEFNGGRVSSANLRRLKALGYTPASLGIKGPTKQPRATGGKPSSGAAGTPYGEGAGQVH